MLQSASVPHPCFCCQWTRPMQHDPGGLSPSPNCPLLCFVYSLYVRHAALASSFTEHLLQDSWSGSAFLVAPLHISARLCSPVYAVSGCRALLHSSVSGQLLVPRATTATIGSAVHFHCWPLHLKWAPLGGPLSAQE